MSQQAERTILDLATNPHGLCEISYLRIEAGCIRATLYHSRTRHEIIGAYGNNKVDALMRVAYALGAYVEAMRMANSPVS